VSNLDAYTISYLYSPLHRLFSHSAISLSLPHHYHTHPDDNIKGTDLNVNSQVLIFFLHAHLHLLCLPYTTHYSPPMSPSPPHRATPESPPKRTTHLNGRNGSDAEDPSKDSPHKGEDGPVNHGCHAVARVRMWGLRLFIYESRDDWRLLDVVRVREVKT